MLQRSLGEAGTTKRARKRAQTSFVVNSLICTTKRAQTSFVVNSLIWAASRESRRFEFAVEHPRLRRRATRDFQALVVEFSQFGSAAVRYNRTHRP